ncbi:N-acetyl-gamma-glutamyl-phosphate reductase [Micromonospora sp. WMMD1076]|uniref:N-acetyl-gamma-glutamyl-phosphate reductase n=1 Tax=Micromonospora sp. WMMD1076 TaxID=3016103 RepID=UPI00249BFAE4|nr:N-acetyl-gamma-glutamyl-phosphate reductase [Micromonospora sp. WMMD1076]WFF05890.1 N-acetyl-gamma-glutamyl-phosphate reductase [Micromonospora sp. WMMD1076]
MIRAAIVGAAGYIGGELLRLLLGHPDVTVTAAVSASSAGRRVDGTHPNLRSLTDLRFCAIDRLGPCDVLFHAGGHRAGMTVLPGLLDHGAVLVDLSGDFRLADPEVYARWYGTAHTAPHLLPTFVPGLPETQRKRLAQADRISVPGCMATAGILALQPLTAAGLVAGQVWVDARTGSSGSGGRPGEGNVHAERAGAMRVFAPAGHRHEAEIAEATGAEVRMSVTGVEAVRGVQVLCRVRLVEGVEERLVRDTYRLRYADEPFVRVVAQRRGLYRLPEPKILTGSNFCDVGFALGAHDREALLVAALDNLVKGGAGNAVQCMNIRFGLPERRGLDFPGLHPN